MLLADVTHTVTVLFANYNANIQIFTLNLRGYTESESAP